MEPQSCSLGFKEPLAMDLKEKELRLAGDESTSLTGSGVRQSSPGGFCHVHHRRQLGKCKTTGVLKPFLL